VFTKNVELLEVVELVTFHYTATRTSNWKLRTAVLKQVLHFAVTSNCTHYGPLLIQLLFHQFSFQERYQDLLNKGYFTYKLRDNKNSAYVGYDTTIEDVNLLAGQLRHKRQSVDQVWEDSPFENAAAFMNHDGSLNTGSHWVTLFFHGQSKIIHYLDSFGSPMKHDLITTIRHKFVHWQVVSNNIKLQDDGYQCGVWTCFIISCITEYLMILLSMWYQLMASSRFG